ncbi:MAG: hypothetical protein MUE94_13280 [Verrucomicrobia bacterium]|nr:hypothetical protein [Verrucomicrobiota bacterium]
MKTKWGILGGCAVLALAVATGCDTEGGSSGQYDGGSTNKPVVVQVAFSQPTCSSSGAGSFNGPVFNGPAGYLYLSPICGDTNDSLFVWIKVVADVDPSAIDHYAWTIRNWSSSNAANGIFDNYDQLIDTNGMFKVQTTLNQVRYVSTSVGQIEALPGLFEQQIDVTVVTKSGELASAYVSLNVHNGQAIGDGLVFGDVSPLDELSRARSGSFADYYLITDAASNNVLALEGEFDTFLVLYDTNLTGIATNDDILPGLNFNSLLTNGFIEGADYFVEVTSSTNGATGNYSIASSTSVLTPVPSPFVSAGTCGSVAGDYRVTEVQSINLSFKGQPYSFTNQVTAGVTIVQDGCDIWYQVNDPAGLIPPLLRLGRLDYNNIQLYSDAYIPQSSDLVITSSSIEGTGRTYASGLVVDSAGTFTGTFLGFPFAVTFTSSATFSR